MRAFSRAGALASLTLVAALTIALSASLPTSAAAQATGRMLTTASGLQFMDTTMGTGPVPKPGQICSMHYTGWLYKDGVKGAKFDSSVDRAEPFQFILGRGQVIAGWDEGVASMRVGSKRTLIIPPDLGYGDRGAGSAIPPRSTLIFEVELLAVR